ARPTSTLTGECFDAACVPACSFVPPRLDGVALASAGEFTSGLPWRLARVGLDGISVSPTGRPALHGRNAVVPLGRLIWVMAALGTLTLSGSFSDRARHGP